MYCPTTEAQSPFRSAAQVRAGAESAPARKPGATGAATQRCGRAASDSRRHPLVAVDAATGDGHFEHTGGRARAAVLGVPDEVTEPVVDEGPAQPAAALLLMGVRADDDIGAGRDQAAGDRDLHAAGAGVPFFAEMEVDDDRVGLLPVSYTHLRAHETVLDLVCRLLLEKK